MSVKVKSVLERDLEKLAGVKFQRDLIFQLYDGFTINEACGELNIHPVALALYRKENAQFDSEIRSAQEYQVDILADKLLHIEQYEPDPKMASVMSKNIQWLASKRLRRVYGEKIDVNHNVIVDIRGAMLEAQQRTLDFIDQKPLVSLTNATDNASVAERNIIDATINDDNDIDPLS